jgi:hypothetical protein
MDAGRDGNDRTPQSFTGKIGKAGYRYANYRKGDAGEGLGHRLTTLSTY